MRGKIGIIIIKNLWIEHQRSFPARTPATTTGMAQALEIWADVISSHLWHLACPTSSQIDELQYFSCQLLLSSPTPGTG